MLGVLVVHRLTVGIRVMAIYAAGEAVFAASFTVEHGGRAQAIVSATERVRAYDLATGDVVWEVGGLSRNVVASPVAAGGLVVVGGSYDWQKMMAIRLEGAKGDLTGTESIVWSRDRHAPYVPSPLLYDGRLYFLKHSQAFLMALDLATGDVAWQLDGRGILESLFR